MVSPPSEKESSTWQKRDYIPLATTEEFTVNNNTSYQKNIKLSLPSLTAEKIGPDHENKIEDDHESIKKETRKIWKNVWIINVAFFLMWSSFVGLAIVQSSIIGMIGTIGLAINFAASIVACIFFGPLLIRLLGSKWTMVICFGGFATWMAYNFYPAWVTVVPASIINGFSNGPIWTAQSTYFTISGLRLVVEHHFYVKLNCCRALLRLLMTQLIFSAVYGYLFNDNSEGAFATYRTFESLGIVLGYAYNSLLCVNHKLYIIIVFYILGTIGYFWCEFVQRRIEKNHSTEDMSESAKERRIERRLSAMIVDSYVTTT